MVEFPQYFWPVKFSFRNFYDIFLLILRTFLNYLGGGVYSVVEPKFQFFALIRGGCLVRGRGV